MALSDIYKLDVVSSHDSEEMRNVFFYRKDWAGGTAQQCATSFTSTIEQKWLDCICSDVLLERLDVVNLGNPVDFVSNVWNDTGIIVAQCLPMLAALNFTLKLNTRAVRPGSKRFSGIPETVTAVNNVTDAAYLTTCDLLRAALGQVMSVNAVEHFIPIVVKRVEYVPDPEVPSRKAYRLPVTDGELVYGDVVTVLFNPRISHQVSRGNGR